MPSSVATMLPPRSRTGCLVTVRTYAERERFLQRRQQLEQQHAAQVSAGLALSAARERGLRVERDRQDAQEAEREVTRLVRRNGPRHPPPPLPQGQADAEELSAPEATPSGAVGAAAPTSAAAGGPGGPPSLTSAPASVMVTSPATTAAPFTTVTLTTASKVVAKPPLPAVNGVARVNGGPQRPPPPSATNGLSSFQPRPKQQAPQPQALQPAQPTQPHQPRGNHRTPSPAPYCPTPDYDSDSSGSTLHAAWPPKGAAGAAGAPHPVPEVEMQSLDSLELLEPRPKQPRPPQTYFQKKSSPSPGRPSVCVTIREYGGGAANRQPSKLTFLNGSEGQHGQQQQQQADAERGDGLQSELAATLSRSNLRTRTEDCTVELTAKEVAASEGQRTSDDAIRGHNVTVTAVNGSATSVCHQPKGNMPNGILKKASATPMTSNGHPVGHGITPAILAGAGAALKTKSSGVPTKTISFGAKATIINEKQLST